MWSLRIDAALLKKLAVHAELVEAGVVLVAVVRRDAQLDDADGLVGKGVLHGEVLQRPLERHVVAIGAQKHALALVLQHVGRLVTLKYTRRFTKMMME